MQINLFGQRNPLGSGRHFGEFCDALKSLNLIGDSINEYDYFKDFDYHAFIAGAGGNDVNVHFFDINSIQDNHWPTLPGVNVHWAIFESTILQSDYLAWLNEAQVILVPSAWGKGVLISNGMPAERIDVVPEGVNCDRFHPYLRKNYQNANDDMYRVLVVSKFEQRKGFPELLEGYAQAFGTDNSARLILKSDNLWMKSLPNNSYDKDISRLSQMATEAGIKNAVFLNGVMSDQDMTHLYNACDVLLFPSRAEGWGLPLIEAMASGLPVATTCYSGHSEFLEPVQNYVGIIDHKMVPMGTDGCEGEWAKAEADDISACLVNMRTNRNHFQRLAMEAASTIRSNYSWRNAAEAFITAIQARMELFKVSINI